MSSGRTRDYVLFYVNGREHRATGRSASLQLADYLRLDQGLCGTKVVCAEGDCGACSVLVGRPCKRGLLEYKPLNSCIQALYQLDCAHIVTVEGLTPEHDLNPIQESMVECHGAQCGYCTPGFIVSLAALFEGAAKLPEPAISRDSVKDALTGNLCRCTGYESIIKSALTCDASTVQSMEQTYPSGVMTKAFTEHSTVDVLIETDDARIFIPHELDSAVRFRSENDGAVIVSGGTDVCVNINKREFKPRNVLSICNLQGLDGLSLEAGKLVVGARVTLEEIAGFVRKEIPEFYRMLWVFGAPQIRYAGTLAGNVANGSPIGDTLPFLFVMEAEVEVTGVHGQRRIPICSFYKGYKTLDMAGDEMITRIFIPVPSASETLRLFKVSKREHLDISSLAAAFLVATESGGNGPAPRVKYARVALGGVGPVTQRMGEVEAFLQGKDVSFETFDRAGVLARSEIKPISDVRGSSDFRNQLAENMFLKFFFSLDESESLCAV